MSYFCHIERHAAINMNNGRTITRSAYDVLELARQDAEMYLNPYVTPEHVLFQVESSGIFKHILEHNSMNPFFFRERLGLFLSSLSSVQLTPEYAPRISDSLRFAIEMAIEDVAAGNDNPIGVPQLLIGISQLKDSLAGYLLRKYPEVIQDAGVPITMHSR